MSEFDDAVKQGDAFYEKGKYLDSVRSFLKALEMGSQDQQALGDLHYRLSQSFHELDRKRPEEAVKHGKEALELHMKIGDQESTIGDLLNLAYISLDVKDENSADKFIEDALQLSKDRPDLEAEIKLTKADMYSSSKRKRAEAKRIYEEVVNLAKSEGMYDAYFAAKYGVISVMRDEGDIDQAYRLSVESLNEIDSISLTIKNKKERSNLRKSVSFIYDMASDLAMELGNVSDAIEIAERMKKE